MVYEKKCDECGKVLDFGGRDIQKGDPEDGISFDDKLYCRECVRRFVKFGTGNLKERIDRIVDVMEDMGYQLGMEIEDI